MSITLGDAVVYLVSDDSQLKAGLANAQGLTGNFASTMAGSFQVAMGQLMAQAVTGLVTAVGDGVQAMGGFFASGVEGAISLDAQLAGIAAKMGATKDEVLPLKDLIFSLSLDPNLVVNTTQAAEAIEMLAGNGAKMSDIVGGLAASTVALANATGNDFGLAAEVATSAMDLFGLKTQDTQKAFDGLVGVTTATKFGINDMKLALAQSGAVFAGMGGDIKDFSTVIAGTATSFASGSDAGTSFKATLQRMANPTAEVKAEMAKLGISLFDSTGQMRPMEEVIGQLNQALYGQVAVTQLVGGATKEQTKAAGEAAEKMPKLRQEIEWNTRSLQADIDTMNAWIAQGKGALGGDRQFRDLQISIEKQTAALEEDRAELGSYESALGAVSNTHATTTTSTKTLTEAERAHSATVIGGSDGMRMMLAMGKMTAKQYAELTEEVNKQGLAFATAATQVDSVQGAFDIFWGVIEAVQIQIGDALLPLIRQMTEVFTVFASVAAPLVVGSFQDIASNITSFMQMVLPAVGELNQAFKDNGIDGMLKLVGDNILGLLIPMGDARDGFAEMNATLNDSRTAIAAVIGLPLANSLTDMANAFKQGGIDGVLQELSNKITTGIPALISSMGQSLLDGASSLLSYTTQLLQSIPQALANFAPDAESAKQLGVSLAQAILSAFGLAVSSGEAVSTPLSAFFSALGTAAMSMSGVLFEVATNVASGFLTALQERFTTIDVSGIFGGLMGVLGGGAIASAFASLAASITPMLPILTSIGAGFSSFMAILAPLTTLIGTSLAPAIAFIVAEAAAMGATFSIMFSSFASGLPFVSSIGAAFTWLIATITPLATFLAPITAALGSVGLGFAALINPITLAGVAIIGLGALWGTNFEQMNGLAKQVFDYLLPTFENLKLGFNGFIAALAPAMPSIIQLFDTFMAAIPSMQVMAGVVIGGLVVSIGTLGNVLAAILPSLGQVISGLVVGLSGALSGAIQFVDGAVQMIKGLLTGDLDAARVGALDVLTGLVSGVEAIFTGLAQIAVGLVTGLAEGIMAAMPDLGDALAELATYIVETAMDLLGVASPSTIFAEIGLNLIEGLIEGISEAADSAYSAIEELTTTLIDTTLEIIESGADGLAEAWVTAWDVVAESTSSAIDGVIEYVGGLADGAVELIGSAMDAISELWDSGWSTMSDLVDGVISTIADLIDSFASDSATIMDGFMTTVSELWDAGWVVIYDLVDSIVTEIYDTLDNFSSDVADIWDGLTTNLADIWDSVWNSINEILAAAIEGIMGYIDGAASSMEATWDALGSILSAVWAGTWSAIEGVMSNASDVLIGLMGGAQGTLTVIWQALADYLNVAWSTAWVVIGSVGEAAWTAIGAGIEALSSVIGSVWETVSGAMSTAWDVAWGLILTAYDKAEGIIKTGVTNLADSVGTAMNSASTTISSIWNTVWDVAAKSTTTGTRAIVSLLGDFLSSAKAKFDDFTGDWVDAGKDIMMGIIDGLALKEDALLDMMTGLAYRALTAAKWVLGIASPSQVFNEEVGVMIVEGMSEGLSDASPSLFDNIGSIATGAVDAAVAGISGARDAIGGIFGGSFGEYISGSIAGQVETAVSSATIDLEGIQAKLRQDLSTMGSGVDGKILKEQLTKSVATGIKELEQQYQQMLSSGMNPDTALAKYTEAAKKLQEIAQTSALANNSIRKGVEMFNATGEKNANNSIYGNIETDINAAIERAKQMKEQQIGLGDIFDFSMGSVEEQLKANLSNIIGAAGATIDELAIQYTKVNKKVDDGSKILREIGTNAISGIQDSSKEMVKQTKDLLAAGMSPQEAMAKYVEMTNQAYQLLNNDTIVQKLPDVVREGKGVLQDAYKDILATVDSQFIGATKSKLNSAGKLLKQGLEDGLDMTTLLSVFKDSLKSIEETTHDTFISQMPGTLATANGLMGEQYRKVVADLEKGLTSNVKGGLSKAADAFKAGLKEGLNPQDLMAQYQTAIGGIKGMFTDELTATIPEGVANATALIGTESDKLMTSLGKDFTGGVKASLKEADDALKKGFANMTDPAQAQSFIATYMASIAEIKQGFTGGITSMIPDAVKEAQGLTGASAEKMAGEISKSFIKASKDKFKDMQAQIKSGLEQGISPQELMRQFNAAAEGISDQRVRALNSVKFDLGQAVPKELMALPETFEAEATKATEAIEKYLVGGIKSKMSEASTAMKEGVKNGLNLEELVTAYKQTADKLKAETVNTDFAGTTGAAIEAQLKTTKDYIEGEFGKEVKGSLKDITGNLKNSLSLGYNPTLTLMEYQKELAKVNSFIGGELGKSMPEAMAEANQAVKANYEDVFGAIGKQSKTALSDAKAAFKQAIADGVNPTEAMSKYNEVASGITRLFNNELGKNAPLAVKAAGEEIADSLKAVKEILKKGLVGDIKEQVGDASKAFKEGLKEGLDPAGLLAAYQLATDAASESAKGLGEFPAVMDETNAKINATTDDMLALLKNNLVGGVKESMSSLKTDLKENMDFGGTVAEALTQLNSQTQALKDEFANGLGGQVPGAIEAANALIDEQKTKLLKSLGGEFVGELKGAIKAQSEVMKTAVSTGADPADALANFNAYIGTVMAGMTKDLTDATPNLARMANGLVTAAQTELSKLEGLAAPSGLTELGKNLLGSVKTSLDAAKAEVAKTLNFGGTVNEALAQFKASMGQISGIVTNEIGTKAPEAMTQAQAALTNANNAVFTQLAGNYIKQVKESITSAANVYKSDKDIENLKATVLAEINNIPVEVMQAMPGAVDEAKQELAKKISSLLQIATPDISTLGGTVAGVAVAAAQGVQTAIASISVAGLGSSATAAIGDGLTQAVTTASQGVQGAVESIAANVTPVVTTIAGAMAEALPEVVTQGDLLIVEVNRIGAALVASGKAILLEINAAITTETINIKLVATEYGATLTTSMAESIANGSQAIYDNLSAITTRVNSGMSAINSSLRQAQASQAALAAVGAAAQQMAANVNNAVTTTTNNVTINNPVPQPAAMDLMMIRNMSDR